jgi:ankyrin repeat protein
MKFKSVDNHALHQLTTAIKNGETERALQLIRPDLPLDAIPKGFHISPVLAAIVYDNPAVLEALLAAGASASATNEMGETLLHVAAAKGSEPLVRALIARGADVNAKAARKGHQLDGRTPLMCAASGNSLGVVKLLLAHGADPFAKDSAGFTALAFAEMVGKRVANYLRKIMATSPATSALGLHDAARAGLLDRVRAVLAEGTPVDARDDLRRTPLHWAALSGHADVARALIDHGANVRATDKGGREPLLLTAEHAEVVRVLLAAGADPNADAGGVTAFQYLVLFATPEVLAALIDAGANLNAKSADGKGILDYAKSNRKARAFLKERLGLAGDAVDDLYAHLKDLPRLAKQPAFEATAARLGELFNRTPAPWRRRKGVVYFHNVSIEKRIESLERLQDDALRDGFLLVCVDAIPEDGRLPLILLPTSNKYAAVLACGTNGINKGHDTEAVIRWLMDMEKENPFILSACGHDFLDGRFSKPVTNAEALAERMIAFCPDMVDQAQFSIQILSRPAQVKALAGELTTSGSFGFWWD